MYEVRAGPALGRVELGAGPHELALERLELALMVPLAHDNRASARRPRGVTSK